MMSEPLSRHRSLWAGTAILALLLLVAYGNTFRSPFVWDDIAEIERNTSLDTLWPAWVPMFEGGRLPHRPLPYYTFALNRALNRTLGLRPNDPWSFHAVNLGIHFGSALLVWWLVARSLWRLGQTDAGRAVTLGWCTASIWAIHPLLTQAVTYIYQRMEILAAGLMAATLCCFVASLDARRPRAWLGAAVACAGLAMASKETACVVPLIVAAYAALASHADPDRRNMIVRQHLGFFAWLCGTWLVIVGILVVQRGMYPELSRLGSERVSYALNQPLVILHYLRLVIWPWPLVFDTEWRRTFAWLPIMGGLVILAITVGGLVVAWRRSPGTAFLLLTFLLLLAPSSSILPASANRPCAEYRMYLPLAVVVFAGVIGASRAIRQPWVGLATAVTVALVLATATRVRNTAYATAPTLWADTLAKEPWNTRALGNLVSLLLRAGDDARVVSLYESLGDAVADNLEAQARLALLLTRAGRSADAVEAHRRAMALARGAVMTNPRDADAWFHLGNLLRNIDPTEAIGAFRRSTNLDPMQADARANLGAMIAKTDPAEAAAHYATALAIDPTHPDALANLGVLAARRGDVEAARRYLRAALESMPTHATARRNLDLLSEP
jgi:tetratricopeptide (TPR) repeat protein